jgi:DNA polymerase III delta prime subunit
MENTSVPWIEKYRPAHFDNIVLDPYCRTFFENVLSKKHFPNLLFYGPPGTGKTTTIINLINEYQTRHSKKNKENIIHLNASDERGIDVIRNQINQFVKSKYLFETGLKFVILDEVDYMTENAQHALKSLLQTCKNNVRFCLICNYISKIDESLQHEFICIRFNQLPDKEICGFIQQIVEKESLNLSIEEIDTIREIYKSDIRSMINYIQFLSEQYNNSLKKSTEKHQIITNKIWWELHNMFLNQLSISSIESYIYRLSIEYNMDKKSILNSFFNYLVRNHTYLIIPEFLKIVKSVVHVTDNVSVKYILDYFCSQLLALYAGLSLNLPVDSKPVDVVAVK